MSNMQALHRSENEGTYEAARYVGLCSDVCTLVASPAVRRYIDQIFETNPPSDGSIHPGRPEVMANMEAAMRADLSIVASEGD